MDNDGFITFIHNSRFHNSSPNRDLQKTHQLFVDSANSEIRFRCCNWRWIKLSLSKKGLTGFMSHSDWLDQVRAQLKRAPQSRSNLHSTLNFIAFYSEKNDHDMKFMGRTDINIHYVNWNTFHNEIRCWSFLWAGTGRPIALFGRRMAGRLGGSLGG